MARLSRAIVFLFLTSPCLGCMDDYSLILCWPTQDAIGTGVRDYSNTGSSGTLFGGPAWVFSTAPKALTKGGVTITSNSYTDMGMYTLSFPGTLGVDAHTAPTDLFNFNGQNFTFGVSFQRSANPTGAGSDTVINYGDGDTAHGWAINISQTGNNLRYLHVGVSACDTASAWPLDGNPQRVMVTKTGTRVYIALNGKPYGTTGVCTGVNDMIAPASLTATLALSRPSNGGNGIFNGKIGQVVVYNKSFKSVDDFMAFANNEYEHWNNQTSPITRR